MMTLSPWQFLLWIVCLEILTVPLVAFMCNTIFLGYFKAKEGHIARITTAIAKTIEKAANETIEKLKKKKEEKSDGI